ncbi:LysE/ArgO family amino acid transporter [Ornithinibacillus californiensis]|uniref:LysE/ArgO family amino acid transporter n=1 Tax=Ornithinibacillus californiensis TaxID=161536 RepID=UPI00064DE600|nr:LysE family transporter [Ornithinibacillus californiensis]
MEAFVHGVILAFGLILPLGIQNVFIFNQGAMHSKLHKALPAVITAAICDTLLISLAVAGVSVLVLSMDGLRFFLSSIGFFFLLYMGWVMWKSDSNLTENDGKKFTAKRQITFAASVSLLNPHAIMDTIGVIGTSSIAYEGYEKLVFAVACIGISWLWFIGLAIVGRQVGQLSKASNLLKRFNQVSAVIIWGMALYMGYQMI